MLDQNDLKEKIKNLMFKNMIHGYAKNMDYHYGFTQPSPERYPFQYFWDTCFHAIILVALGESTHAKKHLRSLFAVQRDDGFIGNIIYWKKIMPARLSDFFQMKLSTILELKSPHMSNIIQPPLIAHAVLRIYEETGDKAFLDEMVPKLKLYYNWLARNRDFDGDHLLSIITPFESGMDFKPTFDPVVGFSGKANKKLFFKIAGVDFKNFLHNYNLKKIAKANYFNVKDAGLNSIYARNLEELANLCEIAGDSEGTGYRELSKKVVKSIVDVMYDDEDAAFYDTYGYDNKKIKILTPTIFYPVINDEVPEEIGEKVMEKHFYKSDEFQTPHPIPSLAQNEAAFNPEASMYIWRGPTWIVNNWLMHKYLVNKKHNEKAKILLNSILQLIEKSGFREYYNPFSGEGYGAKDFTWVGLILDMMISDKKDIGQPGKT